MRVDVPGMTAIASERSTGRSTAPGPCLTAAPGAGVIIAVLFTATVALFLLALLALALPA